MNYIKLKKARLVVVAILMTTSLHAYGEANAIRDCAVKLAKSGAYKDMSNQKVVRRGNRSYVVTGKVKAIRNNSSHKFTCYIRDKEIVSLNMNDNYNNHASRGNPFDDMKYIKRQCKKNIRHLINQDHGRVEKIKFESAHLHNRRLKGRGYVIFKRGEERDLKYRCDFDRRGEIYDGHYKYTRRR